MRLYKLLCWSVGQLVDQSFDWSISLSIHLSIHLFVCLSIHPLVNATYGNWPFFFFNRGGKVNDVYDDKHLGHNYHIDDDDDDDADALADLKR